jgi:hypothetical protein
MAWTASIRVVDEQGSVSGAKVTIAFSLFDGIDSKYTDSSGWAEFEYRDISEAQDLYVDKLWVGSKQVDSSFYLSSGDTRSYAV